MRQLCIAFILCLAAVQSFAQTTKPAGGKTDFPKSERAEKVVQALIDAARAKDYDAMAKHMSVIAMPPEKVRAVCEGIASAFDPEKGSVEIHTSAQSENSAAAVLIVLKPKSGQPAPAYTTDPSYLRNEDGQWKLPIDDRGFQKGAAKIFSAWAEANRVK
jgi:ketosteroid isomerase-like protein